MPKFRPRLNLDTILVGFFTALIWISLDQQVKWWVLQSHHHGGGIEVTPFFSIVLVFNRGISFGLLGDLGVGPRALSFLALAIVVWLVVLLIRTSSKVSAASLGLVIGGALGNVVDRLRTGMVTDYLDFHFAGWHWPAFNIADIGVVCGVAALAFDGAFEKRLPDAK